MASRMKLLAKVEVNVKVQLDPAVKRIRLSIREVARERQSKGLQAGSNSKPQDNSDVVTIGDMVGDLFEKKDNDEKKDNE